MSGRFHGERIAVIGTSCSGKTVLARRLSSALSIPHVELDTLYWDADWAARPVADFRADVASAVSQPRWIVDGNYHQIRDLVWPRATDVIWLDFPLPRLLARGFRRTVQRVVTRERLFRGNRESFVRAFLSHESILIWIFTTHRRRRRDYQDLFAQPEQAHLRVHRVRRSREIEALVGAPARDP